jgi:hypothetical protein
MIPRAEQYAISLQSTGGNDVLGGAFSRGARNPIGIGALSWQVQDRFIHAIVPIAMSSVMSVPSRLTSG